MIPKFSSDEEAEKFFAEQNENGTSGIVSDDDSEVTIIELEGERYEVIDSAVYDGKLYVAILPYSENDEDYDDEVEFTLLEVADDPDDEENCILRTVDDDELYAKIGDEFLKRFESESDEEE